MASKEKRESSPLTPGTFEVDRVRLHEFWDKDAQQQFAKWEKADIATLPKAHFLTGEEHLLIGSSWPFTANYPLTPGVLLAQPGEITEVNRARRKFKELRCALAPLRPALPEPTKEKAMCAILSLSDIDAKTGEAGLPKLVGLKIIENGEERTERDVAVLSRYTFDPSILREREARRYDDFTKSYTDSGDSEIAARFQKSKKAFLKYYRK